MERNAGVGEGGGEGDSARERWWCDGDKRCASSSAMSADDVKRPARPPPVRRFFCTPTESLEFARLPRAEGVRRYL
ncbi:uncharacterized protein STEHIDRAFT_122355 [Stereum hirsutum FP-91666 SS1]|uniref:uncharacterized protein n=1 Tax=Stereum hirsutum (strain FP-91666) TaxID=721885 RepID=UPI0004449349|nr:uncharacterized protein STEHIDRAFT_122355 [Stereum hirsutum FP-91666 SS1]EIM85441.1 hypothetical protein STEHIDRAFT_122355 [Stereum hirsutum FP-91666 SS1]